MFKIRLLIPFPEGSVPLTIFPIIANGILILPSAQVKIGESSWVFTFSYTLHCIHEKIIMVLPLKSIQNLTLLTTSTATWVWTTITHSFNICFILQILMFTSSIFISVYKFIVLKKSSFALSPTPYCPIYCSTMYWFFKKIYILGDSFDAFPVVKRPK